ncbi:MAG: PIG-L family deacetylase [Candidatus Omnitrophica bacterium]|nr:PIG-L family deacetylase [Candidatus Omnitrophota bacterium]
MEEKKIRNILAFGAHPDDIELGCAGTLRKHVKMGNNVYLCVLSEGQEAGDPILRKQEQEEAVRRLGAKELIWGHWIDTKFEVSKQSIDFVESVVARVKPYEIYVNYSGDSHQDHRILVECVIAATRYNKRVLFYEDYTSYNFQPDIYVDIEDVLEDKLHIISAFQSQVSRHFPSGQKMLDGIKAIANFRGFQARITYAEGFKAVRYLKLDIE